jgi:hypothetical protein
MGFLVLLAVGLARCKQPAEPAEPPPAAETPATVETPPAQDPGAAAAVIEQVRAFQQQLRTTRRRVREGKHQESSLHLSEVASALAQRAAESTDQVKEDLEYSASEFSGLSERVFGTPAVTMTEMDAALTRLFWAQAAYHFNLGAGHWADGRRREAAAHFNAASIFVDESVGYYAGGLEAELEALVEQVRDLARHIDTRPNLNAAAVDAEIDDLRQQITAGSERVRERLLSL